MEKMIPANKDSSILIKEVDQFFYHVKLTKVTVIPGKEQFPKVDYEVKCYKQDVFKKLEALRYAAQPIIWYRAGGFTEAIVVHDPVLFELEEAKAKAAEENERKKVFKEYEEKKRKELEALEKKDKAAADKERERLEKEQKEKERIAVKLKEDQETEKKAKEEAKKIIKSEMRKTNKRIASKVASRSQRTT
jgi:hypothetical protein